MNPYGGKIEDTPRVGGKNASTCGGHPLHTVRVAAVFLLRSPRLLSSSFCGVGERVTEEVGAGVDCKCLCSLPRRNLSCPF